MAIKDIIGLLAALIGSTATVLAAWSHVRKNRLPKGELLRAFIVVTITLLCILGIAVFVSQATTITINGQQTVPIPGLPATQVTTPTSPSTPSSSPSGTPSPSTPSPAPSPSPTPSPTSSPAPSPSATPSPSPTPTRTPAPSPSGNPSATPSPKP